MFKSIQRDDLVIPKKVEEEFQESLEFAQTGPIEISRCLKNIDHRFSMHVATDKHQYKPGETVHIRGIMLNEFTHTPGLKYMGNEPFNFRIIGPSGSVVLGGDDIATPGHKKSVIAVDWTIPEGTPGGSYKIQIGKQFYKKKQQLEDEIEAQKSRDKAVQEETEGEVSEEHAFEFYPGSAATMQVQDNTITRVGRNGWKGLIRMKIENRECEKFTVKVEKSHADKSGIFLGVIGAKIKNTDIWKSQSIADISGYPEPGHTYTFEVYDKKNLMKVFKDGQYYGQVGTKIRNFARPLYFGIFMHYAKNQVTVIPPTKGGFFPIATREFDVNNYEAPKFKMNLEFPKKGYSGGETVKANLSVERAEGGAPQRAEIEATARVDGEEVFRKKYVCTTGKQEIEFPLPMEIKAGNGNLNCSVTEGVTENISRTIPILLKKIDCKVYPEGGHFVYGVKNGCYVQAFTLYGDPADFAGFLMEVDDVTGGVRPICEVKTVHEGRGSFEFSPQKGKKYQIKVLQPLGITVPVELTDVKDIGLTMRLLKRSSVPFGHPIEVLLSASQGLEAQLALYRKDKVIQLTPPMRLMDGEERLIKLDPMDVDGVLRITAFFVAHGYGVSDLTYPVAERLVMVKPRGVLDFEIETKKLVYSPGEKAQITVRPKFFGRPINSIVCATITDDSVVQMQEKRKRPPRLVEMVYLENEVKDLKDCTAYIYQEEDNEIAADTCCDLLLGTQGWRRFVYKVVTKDEKFFEMEEYKDTDQEFFFRMLNLPNPIYFSRKEKMGAPPKAPTLPQQPTVTYSSKIEESADWSDDDDDEEEEMEDSYRPPAPSGGNFFGGVRRARRMPSQSTSSSVKRSKGISFKKSAKKKKRKQKSGGGGGGMFMMQQNLQARRSNMRMEESERRRPMPAPRAMARGGRVGGRGRGVSRGPPPRRQVTRAFSGSVGEDWSARGTAKATQEFSGTHGADWSAKGTSEKKKEFSGFSGSVPMSGRVQRELQQQQQQQIPQKQMSLPARPPVSSLSSLSRNRDRILRPSVPPKIPPLIKVKPTVKIVEYAREYAHVKKPSSGGERSDFTETILFSPYRETLLNHITNTYETTLEFDMNDSITSFVVRLDAFSVEGGVVGSSSSFQIKVQKPFFLSPKLPLELSMADEVKIPCGIVNNLPLESKCKLLWDAKGTQMTFRNLAWEGIVGPNSRSVEYFDMKVNSAYVDQEKQELTIRGELEDVRMEDVVKKTVAVKAYGFLTCQPFSGVIQNGEVHEFEIDIPESYVPFSMETAAYCTPSSLGSLVSATKGLVRSPSGCFEQVAATMFPMILAKQFLMSQNQRLDHRIERFLKTGYDKLMGYEIGGGGFDWYGRAPANESLSALGLVQFIELAKCFSIDPRVVDRTRRWLLKRRSGVTFRRSSGRYAYGHASQHTTNAYIIWCLSRSGSSFNDVEKILTNLHTNGLTLSNRKNDNYVTALCSLSYFNFGMTEQAFGLAQVLAQEQNPTGILSSCKDTITRSGGRNKELEITALTTLAWMNFQSAFQPNITKSVNWMVKNNKAGSYGSTQSTVLVLSAIVKYFGSSTDTAGGVDLELNGVKVDQLAIPKYQNKRVDFVDFSRSIGTGKNSLVLRSEYGSNLPYSFAIWYKVSVPPQEQQNLPFTFDTKIRSQRMKEGDTTEIDVVLENKTTDEDGLPMIVAIVAIPSGCQVRMEKLKELKKMEKFDYFETFGARNVVFYWRHMRPQEKKEFSFEVSAYIPGKFIGDASRAYLYYDNDVKFYTPGLQCEIATK